METLTEPFAVDRIPVRSWWEPVVRGVIAILFGIILFAYPLSGAYVFAIFFGAYIFVDGIFAITHAVRSHAKGDRWWAMIARGVFGILFGLFAIAFPGIVAGAIGILVGVYAVVAGALELWAAFKTHGDLPREAALIVIGALTIALGVLLFVFPLAGIITLAWVFAVYAIVAGAMLIAFGLRLRNRANRMRPAL